MPICPPLHAQAYIYFYIKLCTLPLNKAQKGHRAPSHPSLLSTSPQWSYCFSMAGSRAVKVDWFAVLRPAGSFTHTVSLHTIHYSSSDQGSVCLWSLCDISGTVSVVLHECVFLSLMVCMWRVYGMCYDSRCVWHKLSALWWRSVILRGLSSGLEVYIHNPRFDVLLWTHDFVM